LVHNYTLPNLSLGSVAAIKGVAENLEAAQYDKNWQ
jgi:hypothetical protein